MGKEISKFVKELKESNLTPQQYRTLKGQAISGELEAAKKGLIKIKKRKEVKTVKEVEVKSVDVLVRLDRKEVEFLKNDVIDAISDRADMDKEWLVKLAAKLIEECEYADRQATKATEEETKVELKVS